MVNKKKWNRISRTFLVIILIPMLSYAMTQSDKNKCIRNYLKAEVLMSRSGCDCSKLSEAKELLEDVYEKNGWNPVLPGAGTFVYYVKDKLDECERRIRECNCISTIPRSEPKKISPTYTPTKTPSVTRTRTKTPTYVLGHQLAPPHALLQRHVHQPHF